LLASSDAYGELGSEATLLRRFLGVEFLFLLLGQRVELHELEIDAGVDFTKLVQLHETEDETDRVVDQRFLQRVNPRIEAFKFTVASGVEPLRLDAEILDQRYASH